MHRSLSGHSIPLTSRWETLWFAASPRTAARAAQPPAGERSSGRLFLNLWKSDSAPWLRKPITPPGKTTEKAPQRRLHGFTIYARDVCLLAIARSGINCALLLGGVCSWCSVRQRSPACGPGSGSSADCISSARLFSAQCAAARGLVSHYCSWGRGSVSRQSNENQTHSVHQTACCRSIKAESDG